MIPIINIIHQSYYGLYFVNYSFLLGVAGGLIIAWSVFTWNVKEHTNKFIPGLTLILAFAGILNVLAEVKQPGRVIYTLLYGWEHWYGAIIKYGVICISIFLLNLLLLTLPIRFSIKQNKLLKGIVIFCGLFIGVYSGIFMMFEHGIAIWSLPIVPMITLLTGLYSGFSIYYLVQQYGQEDTNEIISITTQKTMMHYTILLLNMLMFISVLLFSWWGHLAANIAVRRSFFLLDSYYMWLQLFIVFIGFVFPILLLLFYKKKDIFYKSFLSLFLLIGAYTLRYILVVAGEGVSKNDGNIMLFQPETQEYFYTIIGIVFIVGLLSALLLYTNKNEKLQKEGV